MHNLIQQQAPTVAPAFDLNRAAGMLILLLVLFATAPVLAQPAQNTDDGMSSRIIIELQQMREEMRELRGLVESQSLEIEDLKRRQRDQYLDLDGRISDLAGAAQTSAQPDVQLGRTSAQPPIEPGSEPIVSAIDNRSTTTDVQSPPPPADLPEVRAPIDSQAEIIQLDAPRTAGVREMQPPTEAERQAYDQAFLALRETRYADAAEGFDRFLRDHPDSSFAPNAQYWLGEVYYVTRDFETALSQFNRLLSVYPDSSKEPDALLKIGFSHYELRQWPEARAALEQVLANNPGTNFSRLAENRLRTMRLEGHF